MFPCYSPFVPPSPPLPVSTNLFSVCISIAALQIGSSNHLSRWYCINIQNLFFSFLLTSLCVIDSRFIHLIRNRQIINHWTPRKTLKAHFWSLQGGLLRAYKIVSICCNNSSCLCNSPYITFIVQTIFSRFCWWSIVSSRTAVYSVSTFDCLSIQCIVINWEEGVKHFFCILRSSGYLEKKHGCYWLSCHLN